MATTALAPPAPAPVRAVALRKVANKAAGAAMAERHTLTAIAAGAAMGLAERNNVPLPYVEALGRPGTYGVLLWIAGKYTKNPMLQHAASGMLSIAAYELAKGTKSGVSGDETIMGEI